MVWDSGFVLRSPGVFYAQNRNNNRSPNLFPQLALYKNNFRVSERPSSCHVTRQSWHDHFINLTWQQIHQTIVARFVVHRATKFPERISEFHILATCHNPFSTWHNSSLLGKFLSFHQFLLFGSCSCFDLISPWITNSWLSKCHKNDINMTKN